jgi:hypothetical protein
MACDVEPETVSVTEGGCSFNCGASDEHVQWLVMLEPETV